MHRFYASRATLESFLDFFQEGQNQHLLFSTPTGMPSSLRDGHPPGFMMVTFGPFNQLNHTLLIRSDGSWDKRSHNEFAAWVADIPLSDYQVSGTQALRVASALQVEAHACRLCCGLVQTPLRMSWCTQIRRCSSTSCYPTNLLTLTLLTRLRISGTWLILFTAVELLRWHGRRSGLLMTWPGHQGI